MATRNQRKQAALKKENCHGHSRRNVAQNSNVPRSQEDYITQVSEEFEERVTKKLSEVFRRTENRILGAIARLDDFLMTPLFQGHSRTAPKTSRNAFRISEGTKEHDSQSDPHPESGIFNNQTTQNSGPEDGHDNRLYLTFNRMTGVASEILVFTVVWLSSKAFNGPADAPFVWCRDLFLVLMASPCRVFSMLLAPGPFSRKKGES